MAGTYTVRFIATVASTVQVTYTVPAGKRAILTSVVSTNATSSEKSVEVRAAGIYVLSAIVPAYKSVALTGFRVVVYGGETIQCWHQAPGQHSHVDGYLFDDVPGAAADAVHELPVPRSMRDGYVDAGGPLSDS